MDLEQLPSRSQVPRGQYLKRPVLRSSMSGMMDSSLAAELLNGTGISPSPDNGTFLHFSPTASSSSSSAEAAAASWPGFGGGRGPLMAMGNVYVYVWVFLGMLLFLLTLLVISLHRLKNIITSSSSVPDCSISEGGGSSSFTNMEICSISSQRSSISALSTSRRGGSSLW